MDGITVVDPMAALLLLVGLVLVTMGILFRAGRLRAWAAAYRNPLLPSHMQNAGFAVIPYGGMFVLWGLIFLIDDPVLTLVLFAASLGLFGAGAYISLTAPAWSKPRWLRTVAPGSGYKEGWTVGRLPYVLLWLVLAGAVASWWYFDLSFVALLVSLAFIVPVLASAHGRRGVSLRRPHDDPTP